MNRDSCPACGGEARLFLTTKDINQHLAPDEFIYLECSRCGLIFLKNTPPDLSVFYPDAYHYFPKTAEEIASYAEHERYKIDLVRRYQSSGKLIEIGPSWGAFSWLAKHAGFDVTAIEMNPQCCRYIHDKMGVQVIESRDEIQSLASIEQRANVIALWHVIEHLSQPWELIRVAADRLEEGGILVLAAPNPEALQFKLLRSRWAHIDAPRHVMQLRPGYLLEVARSAGLECILLTTRDKGSLGWNAFGWEYSFMSFFRNRFLRRLAHLFGKVIALLMYPIESREGKGAAFTVVFRKLPQ